MKKGEIKELRRTIKECLKDVKGENFNYEEKLISGGLIDSFDYFELITKIERVFGIKFPIDRIIPENFDSIDSIEELINRQI